MNTQTILWMSAMAVIFGIIYSMIKFRKIKIDQKKHHALKAFAQSYQCEITEHEFFKNILIGIDAQKYYVFFHKMQNNEIIQKAINLKEMASCEANRITRTVNGIVVIDNLELTFFPLDKSLPRQYIEIYNSDFDSLTLSGELQLLEKWEKIIKQKLTELKKSSL